MNHGWERTISAYPCFIGVIRGSFSFARLLDREIGHNELVSDALLFFAPWRLCARLFECTFPRVNLALATHFAQEFTSETSAAAVSFKTRLEKCAEKVPFSRGFLSATPKIDFFGKLENRKHRVFQAQMRRRPKRPWKNGKVAGGGPDQLSGVFIGFTAVA